LDSVDLAIGSLQNAATAGWLDYRSAELDPRFDTISEDARFRSIIQAMQTKVQNSKRNLSNDPQNTQEEHYENTEKP